MLGLPFRHGINNIHDQCLKNAEFRKNCHGGQTYVFCLIFKLKLVLIVLLADEDFNYLSLEFFNTVQVTCNLLTSQHQIGIACPITRAQ